MQIPWDTLYYGDSLKFLRDEAQGIVAAGDDQGTLELAMDSTVGVTYSRMQKHGERKLGCRMVANSQRPRRRKSWQGTYARTKSFTWAASRYDIVGNFQV